jgi:O-antigen ligase
VSIPGLPPTNRIDAATLLTAYVVLLLAVPSAMKVGTLGTAGAPSTLLAMVAFLLWAWFHLQRNVPSRAGPQPVRTAMVAWLIIMLIVYVHAMMLPIPSDEISPADSGLLRLIGMAGILLAANDGPSSLDRLRSIIRRLVIAVGLVALLGLVQYLTGQLWVDRISIPGLTGIQEGALALRSGLIRPSGTSTHPIEFGVVLTMVLPLAMAYGRCSPTRRWLYTGVLGVVAIAIFLSISRSAMICGAVAVLVMIWSWPLAARLKALAFLVAVFVVVYLSVPGLLGTITRLFTGISDDSSVQSRTGSYEIASAFIGRSPVLGRGFGTFLPRYWIVDNGYLGLLVEGGAVGLLGLLVLIGVALHAARRAAALAVDGFDRELARALVAAVAAGAAGLAFFDTFGFPQSAGCFFLILGLAGGMRRLCLAQASRADRVGTIPPWSPAEPGQATR